VRRARKKPRRARRRVSGNGAQGKSAAAVGRLRSGARAKPRPHRSQRKGVAEGRSLGVGSGVSQAAAVPPVQAAAASLGTSDEGASQPPR